MSRYDDDDDKYEKAKRGGRPAAFSAAKAPHSARGAGGPGSSRAPASSFDVTSSPAVFGGFGGNGDDADALVGNATTVSTVRAAFPRMQTVAESRAIAAEAREKFLWRPFAAATADDVPTCSDGDGDAPPELREDETP